MGPSVVLFLLVGLIAHAGALPPPPGRPVEVNGRTLHLHCVGNGAPTVVVEAGASSFVIDFALVQPSVAAASRACAYDRIGHRWSETFTRLATISSNLRHLVVLNAGHEIHLFQPAVVIQAIQDVVEAARNETRLAVR